MNKKKLKVIQAFSASLVYILNMIAFIICICAIQKKKCETL